MPNGTGAIAARRAAIARKRRVASRTARHSSAGGINRPSSTTSIRKPGCADVLARLPDHPARRIHDLLPWNWRPHRAAAEAA